MHETLQFETSKSFAFPIKSFQGPLISHKLENFHVHDFIVVLFDKTELKLYHLVHQYSYALCLKAVSQE